MYDISIDIIKIKVNTGNPKIIIKPTSILKLNIKWGQRQQMTKEPYTMLLCYAMHDRNQF